MPTSAAVLVAATFAFDATSTQAQTSPDLPTEFQGRITPGRQSAGVPPGEVSCGGQRRDNRLILTCLVRFNAPISVTGARVSERPSGREWIPQFRPLEPEQDDTAFFILIDRANPARRAIVQRASRELAKVFSGLGSKQRAAVASYSGDLTLLEDFSSDGAAIAAALNRVQVQGTAKELYRHALEAIRRLEGVNAGRRVLIIMSDGRTDDQAFSRENVQSAAQRAGVRIVALGYAQTESESSFLQNLEWLTTPNGVSYRVIGNRALPEDFRKTILTRFGSGGILEAESPTRDVPAAVDVTLRHGENRTTTFSVALAPGQVATPSPSTTPDNMTPLDQSGNIFEQYYSLVLAWVFDNQMLAALIGAAVVLVAGAVTFALISLRPPPKPAVAAEPSRTPQPLYGTHAEPVPPPPATSASAVERVGGENPESAVTVIRPVAKPSEAEAPVIAWLEFNGKPGRFPVRKNYITIGRQTDNDAVTDPADPTVSRYHAVLSINTDGQFKITNRSLETRSQPNPIFVNGEEQEHAELFDGDMVKLGTGTYGFVFRTVRNES